MACPHNRTIVYSFTVLTTKDDITYRYGYCDHIWEASDIAKEFVAEGYSNIKLEWHNKTDGYKRVMEFCHECKRFHLSSHR